MFVDVAFKNSVSGPAMAVALALSGIERPLFPERPGALITGDQAATGKTTLINMIVASITGHAAPAMAFGKDDEELRKMVLAVSLLSPSFIAFDNIERGTALDSPQISRMMTAETVQDRELGFSRIVNPLATTVPIFTGIRVTTKGEMGTRIYTIEIESPGLRPADRNFTHEQPVEWVIENRLTILTYYYNILMVERAAPKRLKTRFKPWYDRIGYPIELVSGIDCATDMFGGGEDEEEAARVVILERFIQTFPDPNPSKLCTRDFTATEMAKLLSQDPGMSDAEKQQAQAFGAAVRVLNKDKEFAASADGIGRVLKSRLSGWVRINDNQQAKTVSKPSIGSMLKRSYRGSLRASSGLPGFSGFLRRKRHGGDKKLGRIFVNPYH
jgi:hypothetical protein